MPDLKDAEKEVRVDAAAALLRKAHEKTPSIAAFAEAIYERGAAQDLVTYTPAELAAFAESLWKTMAGRVAGSPAVHIHNPDFDGAGTAHQAVTAIEVINDNMPFLVDSVMGELHDAGIEVQLVLHPVVAIKRDKKGKLTDFGGLASREADKGFARESVIAVHVSRIDSLSEREQLVARLESLFGEVRQAVEDWQPMMARVKEVLASYKETPPPLPVDELAEAIQFMEWLVDANFTFLGVRDYIYQGDATQGVMASDKATGLGLLRDANVKVLRRGSELVTMTPEIRDFLMRPELLIITKANVKSRVHRRVHMDYIGVKLFGEDGQLSGELRMVGLFTSTAYTRSTRTIPYIRRKVDRILTQAGYDPASHSGKALLNVLESYPRDEFFQGDEQILFDNAMAILELFERPRVRVLPRRDKFDRFVSVLVFVPRDHYTTDVRFKIGELLSGLYDGVISAWSVVFLDQGLARVHFIIGRYKGETPSPDQEAIEAAISDLMRTWADGFRVALKSGFDPETARTLFERYAHAFSAAYREAFTHKATLKDLRIIEKMSADEPTGIDFYLRKGDAGARVSLKLYNRTWPIPLSERVPILEQMGFRVINERTYKIEPSGGQGEIFLHDMSLERRGGVPIELTDELDGRLEALFMAVWGKEAESDGYNALVLNADLNWRDIAMLRALSRYLRQARIPYSQDYMWGTLNRYPQTAARFAELFHLRFAPGRDDNDRSLGSARIEQEIIAGLDEVSSLDDDRILRRFLNLLSAILRTNFFQVDAHGMNRPTIAFKLNPRQIDELPAPRPFREIFVYSPRVEGVHLRFGMVARGGLRWSDRPQDFRTEILGLVKAQQVKNAVIVPVGSKGGFVPKWLPEGGSREEIFAEGTEAYKIFVSTLLDVTDNLEGDRIIPPYQVVRHDGDDPYLVVAADKGTATFSDTANGISEAHGFWLGDAFASGGSAGYDHKKMGITARGAWEAVKRHFREMDIDIQTTPFTVAGVGDMSGDVFGNGMLLSRAIKLVAAFDHRDIFFDPDPDIDKSYAERERMFGLGRSSWQDYDTSLISEGGGVFSRSMKSIPLSKQIQELLGLRKSKAPPQEIITAILKMQVDLFWFGGIGTYVRASAETDAEVGDRANDAIRIPASDFGCKVVGEGANLGMTQLARIEFSRRGGRCNSDAIDNSAGVNSSDVEVNIKIALGAAIRARTLDTRRRNKLLVTMTEEVGRLVLRNNYLQTLAISLAEGRGAEDFGYQRHFMQDLEARDLLDREVEELPDELALNDLEAAGDCLTRPEIGVLLAYAKITLFDELVASSVPDDAYLGRELFRYFPLEMRDAYHGEIAGHRLRREIISTMLANSMINRGGPTMMVRVGDQTGATPAEIAQGFAAVRDAYGLTELNDAIDALDTKVPGAVQLELYRGVQDLILEQVVWFLRNVSFREGIAAVVERFSGWLEALSPTLDSALPEATLERYKDIATAWKEAGVGEELADRVARLPLFAMIPDIILVAEETGKPLDAVAGSFFTVASHFRISRLDGLARAMKVRDYFDGLALDRARRTLAEAHRLITAEVLAADGGDNGLSAWLAERREEVERTNETVANIVDSGTLSVSRLAVAAGLLADLSGL